jgi:hypothetical protein
MKLAIYLHIIHGFEVKLFSSDGGLMSVGVTQLGIYEGIIINNSV